MPAPSTPDASDPCARAVRFTEFYRETYPSALRFARLRAVGADGEALVADAFEVVLQRVLEGGDLGRSWFFRVLRNKIGDFYRSSRRSEVSMDPGLLPPDLLSDDWAELATVQVDVRHALLELEPIYREPLLLAYWCDLSGAEAAHALGVREGTFRVRLLRAKRLFLDAFDNQSGDRPARDGEEVTRWIAQSD